MSQKSLHELPRGLGGVGASQPPGASLLIILQVLYIINTENPPKSAREEENRGTATSVVTTCAVSPRSSCTAP